jgi:hypothetical protein
MRRLRARRAAGLQPVPVAQMHLRNAEDLLLPAVETTIAALQLGERDAAVAQLARAYAAAIDEASVPAYALRYLGPLLLKVLTALRAVPAARAGARPERPERPGWVAQMRAEHQASVRRRGG